MIIKNNEIIKRIGNTTIYITDSMVVHTPEQVAAILERIKTGAQQSLSSGEIELNEDQFRVVDIVK